MDTPKSLNHLSELNKLIPTIPESPAPNVFSQLIGTLSSTEASTLREAISRATFCVTDLERLVPLMESTIDSCRKSLDGHKKFIENHSKALSHARLPAEVWREIFMWAATDQYVHDKPTTFQSAAQDLAPLSLTGVSRTWRSIVIRTPTLWSTITIFITKSNSEFPFKSNLTLLNMWLTRSRSSPLSISVRIDISHITSYALFPSEGTSARIFSMLAAHGNRWRSVYFDLPVRLYLECRVFPSSLGSLEDVSIAMSSVFLDINGVCGPRIMNCPKLRSLTLETSTSFKPVQFLAPWNNIETLIFGKEKKSCNPEDVLELLTVAQRLKVLSISIIPNQDLMHPRFVRHGCLQRLDIVNGTSALFTCMDLPTLDHLTISRMWLANSTDMRSFFSRSQSLRTLIIERKCDFNLLSAIGPECQAISFSIKTFAVKGYIKECIDFLTKLSVQSSPSIMPSLRTLEFHILFSSKEHYQDNDPVLTMSIQDCMTTALRCREAAKGQEKGLQDVKLDVYGRVSDFTRDALTQLREIGLDGLTVSIYPGSLFWSE